MIDDQALNSISKLQNLISRAFPDKPQLKNLPLPKSITSAWNLMQNSASVDPRQFLQAVSETSGIAVASSLKTDSSAIKLLPEAFARSQLALPLLIENNCCHVAIANPSDDELKRQIEFAINKKTVFVLAAPDEIELAIHVAYSNLISESVNETGRLVIQAEKADDKNENVIVSLAQAIIKEAIQNRASDLHVQSLSGGGTVRVRVDGMLKRIALLPGNVYDRLVRYLKAQSAMNISKKRIAQDGRMSLTVEGYYYDLRVSSLPARGGERLVIRFLDQTKNFQLSGNGFSLAEIQTLRRLCRYGAGLVLITGPTGSGKTTTLYALLQELNQVQTNILTVEDPIEYTLTGLSQVEVNNEAGLTFASALRSALRQDPDIILIGEIRDQETAQIAFQAALTGHLVLSTLHTNDAISAIPRLLDLNVDPTIIADSLIGIVAQRLCRRLCPVCRTAVTDDLINEEMAFKSMSKIVPPYRANVCEACDYTGYLGRLPITEILEVDEQLRQKITDRKVKTWSYQNNELNSIKSLSSSAARHIISGDTSVKEAFRVIGRRFWTDLANEYEVEPEQIVPYQQGDKTMGQPGVLILGYRAGVEDTIAAELQNSWFEVFRSFDADDAKKLLEQHDNIVHVILNLNNQLNETQLIRYVRDTRTRLAWSRLPALMLLPEQFPNLEQALVEDGATQPCIVKPAPMSEIIRYTHQAITSGDQK
jgi:type IV pilus assembly protein PilB